VGKTEGQRHAGRLRLMWKVYIKMDLKELELEGVDWVNLAQDRDEWRVVVDTLRVT
jgi:hypothetical protein